MTKFINSNMMIPLIVSDVAKIQKPMYQVLLLYSNLASKSSSTSLSSSGSIQEFDNFNILKHKDWLSPTELVKIFQNLKDPNLSLNLLNQVSKRKDYKPNQLFYTTVINNLAAAKNFDGVEEVMKRIKVEKRCRLDDDFFYNVIKIYGHFAGRINRAVETLFAMPQYSCWPTVKTFNFVLNLLVTSKQFDIVHEVYMGASNLGVEVDACCLNIIIKGLCECGDVEAALKVLEEFPKQNCVPNVRTFSTLMHGLCRHGKVEEALRLFERMENEGVEADAITFNILIVGLRKHGRAEEGIKLFDRMMLKGCAPNPGTYQEVLYGLLDMEKFVEAKEFMSSRMFQKGVKPSFESYKLLLQGICDQNLVEDAHWVLKKLVHQGFLPKMKMWKQLIQCVVSGSKNIECISYENITEK
ncbi:pentatricopeptide repeat-containing protein At3g14580, mitochondrial isoform X1 [Daucus carota subsp. sativus]|nr:PREDICTED: pentatricopeptide repeat-containing protein At3g14580, mitochondrial-like isoform X1 [Daucus carota subsp. sativus]XP_017257738.1 PREDICTED: pentatricopeptide repeat-containing protein At3g14580, mitochondrial-like isoform X1 [Daucus carota subsp. sativus]